MTTKIAIIGLGPGGLGTLKVLLDSIDSNDQNQLKNLKIDVFEALNDVGGIWNYDSSLEVKPSHATMYDYLETNLHKDLMKFTDFDFDDSLPNFPTRIDVFNYLKKYYNEKILINHSVKLDSGVFKINFNTRIVNIDNDPVYNTWSLESETKQLFSDYNYLIVGTGHFNKPYIPTNIPGFSEWNKIHANTLIHSKYFKNPKFFKNKKVVVVGGSSSGSDIATQITSTASSPVYWSVTNPEKNTFPVNPFIVKDLGEIQRLDSKNKSVEFANGAIIENVDYIVFATGFKYNFNEFAPNSLPSSFKLEKDGKLIRGLYKHLVVADNPTLFFTLLPTNIIPFRLSEHQASLIVTIIAGKFPKDLIKQDSLAEADKKYHAMATPKDMEYYNELFELVEKYNPEIFKSFRPTYWKGEIYESRLNAAKQKFERQEVLNLLASSSKTNGTDYTIPFTN